MKITAAVLEEANKPFVIEELELDEPREDEILIRVLGVGLCHTDVSMIGRPPFLPLVLGHEGAGIVEKVGSKVKKFKVGDKVTASFTSCGSCRTCLQGKPAYCLNFTGHNVGGRRPEDGSVTMHKNGESVYANFFGQSAFATHMLTRERNTVKLPDDVPVEMMGPLGCGIQTGAGAVMNTFNVPAGSSVAVFGVGSVGLSSVMAAKAVGATTIIAVDIHENRLKLARKLGATHTVNSKEEDAVARIMEITEIGADFAIDTSGVLAVTRQAIESTFARGGKIGLIGVNPGDLTVNYRSLSSGRTVKGIMEGDAVGELFIPTLVNLYKQGKFPFDKLVKYYKLSEINEAINDMHSGVAIKPILVP